MATSSPRGSVNSDTARTPRRRPRHQNRRVQILRRAARLFLERGFEGTSMDDIASAVNLTKPALYYYFEGKQHLLAAIIDYGQDLLRTAIDQLVSTSTSDEELLRRTLHMHAAGITNEDDAAFSLLGIEETRYLLAPDRRRITRRKKEYVEFIRDTLDRLKAQGKLQPVDTTAAAYSLVAMVMWIPKWYNPAGRLSARQVADEVAGLALRLVMGQASLDTAGGSAPRRRGRAGRASIPVSE